MSAALEYVSPRYLSAAETAKLVRQALKREFPGVKFSVRSKTYSGGASIDVSWVDGPTSREVDRVVGVFAGSDFDGMIDLKISSQHWLNPDGTAAVAHAGGGGSTIPDHFGDPIGPNAQLVRFGADYVFTHREISDEWRAGIFALFTQITGREFDASDKWGVWQTQLPLAVDRLDGRLLHMVETDTEDLSTVFHQFTGYRQGGSLDASAPVAREP